MAEKAPRLLAREAGKQIDELKKFAAKDPQTRFFEAQLAYQKKDFKTARDLALALLQQAPNNPRVLQLAGATELQMGAVDQAQVYLDLALQKAPELALARRLLIVAYLRSVPPVDNAIPKSTFKPHGPPPEAPAADAGAAPDKADAKP